MKKKTILNVLTFLKKNLKDKKSIDAILHLQKKSEEIEEADSKQSVGGELPIPKEISDHEFGFALFSDGACRGNPGPGAWGMVGQDGSGEIIFEASGIDVVTTNNKMELQGAISALESLVSHLSELKSKKKPFVILYSDSKYVVDGILKWVPGWKSKGWKKADKKAPENLELWQELDRLAGMFSNLSFQWVKGHAGHPQNEYCDQLANFALDESGF